MPISAGRLSEVERLKSLRALNVLDSPSEPEFDALTQVAALTCGTPIALISLVDAERQWFKANVGLCGTVQTTRDVAFCAHAIQQRELFEVPDAAADPRFRDNPLVTSEPHIRFYAGMPLRLRDDTCIGTLCVLDHQPRLLTAHQREILHHLALVVVKALEGRRATQTLSDSEARFRTLASASPLGVFSTDAQGYCTYTNSRCEEIFEQTAESSAAHGWHETLHPDDCARVFDVWRRATAAPREFDMEFRVRPLSGTVRHVRSRAQPLVNTLGEMTGFVGVVEDTTARVRAEQWLLEGQKRLEHIIEGTGAGTWEWNVQTGEARINERWAAMLGYTLADLSPISINTWLELIQPDDRLRSGALLERHFSGEISSYECEARILHRSGEWIWICDRGKVITWTVDGKPEWMFGTHLDITERKLADQRLEEAQLVLRTVIDTLPQRVAWKSLTGRYFGSNRVFAEDHGYSSLAGLTVHDLGFEAAACLEFEKSDQRVIESGVDVLDQVVQIKNSRLESEWISRSKVLMRNQHGQATGLLVTYLDVTDFKTKELSLAAARDAANAANEAKSEFLATMSHEIRTPLNGILGCAELLQDTGLDSEQQHLAGTIVNCGRGLLHTLNDLLDLSKMTKGEMTLEEIEFDPRILAEEAVRLFVPRAKEKNIEANFVWHIEDPVVLKADPLRLRQVLMNLINNAIKFTDVGHVTLEVRAMPTKSLRLEVIDSGIGIAPEHHEHIFGRFTQVACSAIKTNGGTGLGLAISKQLIDALGGTIGVSSTLGTGSCFWVEMPLHVAPEADTKALPCTPMAPEYSPAEHPQPVDSLAKAKSSARGVRLLLAEDEPTNQFVARRMLEGMGYSIDVVDNGEAAVAKAREVSYAAILMDCRMPILDGIGATKAIRLFEQLQAGRAPVPIIALTAYATEAIQQSCYAAGMNDFLTKPLESSKLRSTLEAWSSPIKRNVGESLSQTATSPAN